MNGAPFAMAPGVEGSAAATAAPVAATPVPWPASTVGDEKMRLLNELSRQEQQGNRVEVAAWRSGCCALLVEAAACELRRHQKLDAAAASSAANEQFPIASDMSSQSSENNHSSASSAVMDLQRMEQCLVASMSCCARDIDVVLVARAVARAEIPTHLGADSHMVVKHPTLPRVAPGGRCKRWSPPLKKKACISAVRCLYACWELHGECYDMLDAARVCM